jgi:hypothetical protein
MLVLLLLLNLAGCSGFTYRAREAASIAVRDPWTWGPLVGATAIGAVDGDERLSRWAKTETPVFGSRDGAQMASDHFRLYASSSAWATFLAAPPQGNGNWLVEKGMDAGGNMVGLSFARNTTGVLKPTVHRERPHNGPEHDSFPSAHSTDAFAHASMGRYYADDLRVSAPLRTGIKWGMSTFAAATAWGRVEGGVHYPTDVLVGAAIANFTTRFFLELNAPGKATWRVRPRTGEDGGIIIDIETPL